MLDVRCSFMITRRRILGIQFFNGDVDEAVELMSRHGGFLVAPSGTCFARFREDEMYRRAVLAADLAIADSGLMVLLWRLLRREKISRISGLKYLKHLLRKLKGEGTGEVFWVLPSERARKNYSSGRAGNRFQLPSRTVMSRRATACKSKTEISFRWWNKIARRM